jgi:diguanylate cyclase (GGDEF)-like protein
MARDIASSRTLAETVDRVMHHVGVLFAPLSWSLLLRDSKTGHLRFVHATGPGSEALERLVLERGMGVAGWVAEHGEALLIPDTSKDTRFHPGVDALTGMFTKSIIAVPLKTRDQVYGVIELINRLEETPFDHRDLAVLQTIGDFAALAIERTYYLRSVKRLALTDPLTDLPNRRAFEYSLDREIERTRRHKTVFSLLMIDVDRFKAINDGHGHAAGDESLRAVAQLLQTCARKVDFPARIGGDEFALVLPGGGPDAARQVAKRIEKTLENRNRRAEIPLSLSIGIRTVDPAHPEVILAQADRAMYLAKASSGDRSSDLEGQLSSWLENGKD